MDKTQLTAALEAFDQQHILRHWDELDDAGKAQLAEQIQDIDLSLLSKLVADEDEKPDFAAIAKNSDPPPAVGADGSGVDWSTDDARGAGEQAIREGKLAAIVVAGGQGTRLGFDKPKGMFPVGPLSNRTLFQVFADRIAATSKRYDVTIPWYVMTSEATDAATRQYFEDNDYLGLPRDSVRIFKQGTMPAVDAESGKLLLASPGSLALSPDGHGGTVAALARSGSLDDMEKRGVQYLFYFQVDNPLIQLMDPTFIGHHLLADSELTSQVVRKRYPTERVGNVVQVGDRMQIIEYSDLPDEAAEATNDDGSLRLWAGSIAVHVFNVDFLRRASESAEALPFHRANKKVPYLDESGQIVKPDSPNAIKFEKFIFDLLPQARRGIVVEVVPADAFAPVKNAEGAENDTPSLARRAISDLHKRWLRQAGVSVADDATVEISPSFALDADQIRDSAADLGSIDGDQFLTRD
ncbi:UTP--glucose-1-phosphate uridylyltransferase [Crateriforma conspicua]|uniref:Putative uridylyltransferase n=1 Tax=Crateriforma conspicua TaxID=2527996 RepID=A0A5C5Y8F6_9PLAN|nr:UDPGP type 1 family protein [Crateriforma conspicua]TWT71956.1 putative uridylyltransferase [Crateriforma conspicua]